MLRHLLDRLRPKASLRQKQPRRARLTLESLEDRLVPALASTAPLTVQGASGTVTLSNTGQLTFTAGNSTTTLETICSSYNVDGANNLFEQNSNGMLWELPSGANFNVIGPGGWRWLDNNSGSVSLAADGTLVELKLNGTLWRFANGVFDARPLASGVTRADVDAAGNVYALQNGNLLEWAPGQSTATTLNNSPGDVVSFQVGNNTVAWQLGLQDTHKGAVEVSFQNGQSPVLLSDNNTTTAVISQYGVDAAGFLFVVDSGAATNKGVTILQAGGGSAHMVTNVDNGTDIAVNGNAHAATSFSLSPDGTAIAVLDSTKGNLSAWKTTSLDAATAGVSSAGPELELEHAGLAKGFGIANDLRVYELTTAATLQYYAPFANSALTPTVSGDTLAQWQLTPTVLSANVAQWQLGPNGEAAYLTTSGSFVVMQTYNDNDNATGLTTNGKTIEILNQLPQPTPPRSQNVSGVAQLGFAANGQLYYLSTAGTLFQGRGNFTNSGGYNFSQIDTGVAAFVVNSDSALLDIESNGNVWRLTGSPGNVLGGTNNPASTIYIGWVQLDSGANVGTLVGAKLAVGMSGTPLYALPNGDFYLLVGGAFTELSANRSTVYAIGQTNITLQGDDNRVAGITANVPALDALLAAGSSFSTLSTSGLNPIAPTLF
jgi:hypothetical protein